MTNRFHKFYLTVILSFIILNWNENLLATGEDDSCIVQITDLRHRDLVMQGFTLDKDLKVKIEAVGSVQRHSEQLEAYAWILDADTRKLVWELSYDNASEIRRRYELEFKGELILPKGNYEVYYAINPSRSYEIRDFGDFMRDMFDGFRPPRRYSRDWGITIKPAEGSSDMKYVHPYEPPQDEQAIVQMIKLGDNVYQKQGFSLGKPMEVRIYAIGEGSRRERELYDYGWIINANSREKIWQMSYRNTVPAGGAEKNKMFDDRLSLPDGNYMVYFVTDGSHSFEEWNDMPPYD
ncbi:MAG: hypothetical protein ONB05_00270, partial [candidate division KSB1 bacterium]|nr:hypothetical protein [candidate division KSB1 bacterium]